MSIKFDLKKLSKIPKRYKIAIIVTLNLVIFGVIFAFVLYPQFDEKKRLEAEYRTATQELDRLVQIKNNMDKTRQEYAALQGSLQAVLTQMPEQKDIPNLLRQVSMIGQESKLRVKSFAPRDGTPKDFYVEVPFELRYSGTYHNMGHFLDGIRHLDRIIHVTSFTLETKATSPTVMLEGNCTAKTYVYSREAAKAAPAATPADKPASEKKDAKNEPVVKK